MIYIDLEYLRTQNPPKLVKKMREEYWSLSHASGTAAGGA